MEGSTWNNFPPIMKIESNGHLPSMCNEVEHALAEKLPDLASPEKVSSTQVTADVDFFHFLNNLNDASSYTIEPSSKTRGEYYLVEGKYLTTRPGHWVPIKVHGLMPTQSVRISLRYAEVNYEAETPVQCFNNCIVDAPNMRGLDLGENAFFVNHESKIFFPSAGNSHPQLVIMPTDGTFHVLFRCRNSCDSHKKYGKNRFLLLETLDMAENVLNEEKFSLRVCQSVKRDHAEHVGRPSSITKKRKISGSGPSSPKRSSHDSSTIVFEINEDLVNHQMYNPTQELFEQKPLAMPVKKERFAQKAEASEPFIPQTICAKMRNEEDQEFLKKMIERLGGSFKYL